MALPIGHRNGVKVPTKGNGLYRIRRPRGIPFYSPAEVYQKQDCIEGENVNIVFKARGRLTNGTPEIIGRLRGSTRMMFAPGADPSSTFDFDVTQSYKLKGDTTIHFYQRANPTLHHVMTGASWIVFNLRALVHKLTGGTSMTFTSYGQMRTYVLKGNIDFTFSAVLQSVKLIKFGLLYNFPAIIDARNICAAGWHVPTNDESKNLMSYIEPGYSNLSNTIGQKLKEEGTTYWNIAGGTNIYGFNCRGNGNREVTFTSLGVMSFIHTATEQSGDPNDNWHLRFQSPINTMSIIAGLKWHGRGIRLVKDSTILSEGEMGTYTGNDGQTYPSIGIGASGSVQEWLACNLAETKYRNGDSIPEITDDAEWAAASGGAMCAYDNDWSNVFI